MFDTTYMIPPRASDVNVRYTSIEQRAPTDDSVRLLKEMEDAVNQKVLNSIRFDNNELKGVCQILKNHLTGDNEVNILVELNGKKEITKVKLKEWLTKEQKIELLIKETSEFIAQKYLLFVFTNELYENLFRK